MRKAQEKAYIHTDAQDARAHTCTSLRSAQARGAHACSRAHSRGPHALIQRRAFAQDRGGLHVRMCVCAPEIHPAPVPIHQLTHAGSDYLGYANSVCMLCMGTNVIIYTTDKNQ